MIIKKKIWPKYFNEIVAGKKKCELRLADFAVEEGDELVLEEWDPQTKSYTGRSIKKKVTYVLRTQELTFWTKAEIEKYGYQIIQME